MSENDWITYNTHGHAPAEWMAAVRDVMDIAVNEPFLYYADLERYIRMHYGDIRSEVCKECSGFYKEICYCMRRKEANKRSCI